MPEVLGSFVANIHDPHNLLPVLAPKKACKGKLCLGLQEDVLGLRG
ncbi:MAG: hypothetical protein IJU79_05585 [Desulfovibrionaceae bacterium]|nr:hypothetical protein [Desulfovibrionaceae bacterium]